MANEHMVLGVSYIDINGVPASDSFYGVFDSATTVGALLADVATFIALVAAVTKDKITGVRVGVEAPGTGTAAAGSESALGVNISMEVDATHDWPVWIPAMDPALLVGGRVNITTGAIKALGDELVGGTGAITWESAYKNGFASLESAAKSKRKLRGPSTKSVNP